ncbi:sensor histidine kinase [Nocardia sp. NPDC051570]|uniref:sensor histidine kinase n=1 Tax=Nocardia sp. NPDC051570 TaxID=3364324 RepID=UPI0037ADDB32
MRAHLRPFPNLPPLLIDTLLAVVLTVWTVAGMHPADRTNWLALALTILSTAPIVLRRYAPVMTMLVIGGAMVAYSLLGYDDFLVSGLGLLAGMFAVARHRSQRVAAVTWACVLTAVLISNIPTVADLRSLDVINAVGQTLAAWALGDSFRRWSLRNERLAEQAARAAVEERVRIARELHDIVAHHMSVISLQAGVAGYVLDTDLPAAREALAAVGDSSRAALAEMRRLLDLLRVDPDGKPDYSPQPGLAQLTELIEPRDDRGFAVLPRLPMNGVQ